MHSELRKMKALPTPSPLKIDVYGGIHVSDIGNGWKKYVHIDGRIYFYHASTRVLSHNDMEDRRFRRLVNKAYRDLIVGSYQEYELMEYVPEDSDIIMRFDSNTDTRGTWHEDEPSGDEDLRLDFICHRDASYISLDFVNDSDIETDDIPPVKIETNSPEYWDRIFLFPMHLKSESILTHARQNFLNAMAYFAVENIFESKEKVLLFNDRQVERLMEIYHDLSDTAETNPAMIPVFIFYMSKVITETLTAQRGSLGYATARSKIQTYVTWQLRISECLLACVFFGVQRTYRERLNDTRAEWTGNLNRFRAMFKEFLAEWTDSTLLATVFVGTNVTFLSLPSITTLQRTASLASAIFSVLSISSGLYHLWHHRTKTNIDYVEAIKYAYYVQGRDHVRSNGLDPVIMGFFLALPVASLIWAVFFFFVALLAICIQGMSGFSRVLLSIAICAVLAVGGLAYMFYRNMWRLPGTGASGIEVIWSRNSGSSDLEGCSTTMNKSA